MGNSCSRGMPRTFGAGFGGDFALAEKFNFLNHLQQPSIYDSDVVVMVCRAFEQLLHSCFECSGLPLVVVHLAIDCVFLKVLYHGISGYDSLVKVNESSM